MVHDMCSKKRVVSMSHMCSVSCYIVCCVHCLPVVWHGSARTEVKGTFVKYEQE